MKNPKLPKFNIIFIFVFLYFNTWLKGEICTIKKPLFKTFVIANDSQETLPKHTKKPSPPRPVVNYSKKTNMIRSAPFVARPILQKVWFDTSSYFQFSDTIPDRFWIKAVGDYDYKAMVFFKIINKAGKIIYRDSFPLMDILGIYIEGGGNYATRTRKEEAIEQYVEEFFYENNFNVSVRDLSVSEVYENYIVENYQAFQNKSPRRTFVYSKLENSQSLIGYHPQLKKALMFYEYR
ncbi:MAG: hypothetical protein Q8M15_14140 [Bacteroidota bacterium]|nr:hypothetical protein [Bacteroidota bacterium]